MTATLHEAFGENLRDARERAGVSQAALARAAQVSPSEISRLEGGQREPLLTTIVLLARALEIEPIDLMRGIR
ncbi:MAG: helix-turn-helix transcriptional regulator [Thermoleophilaceae bacterium]